MKQETPVGSTITDVSSENVMLHRAKIDKNRHENGGLVAQDGTENGTETAQKGRRTEAKRTLELKASLPDRICIGEWTDGRRKPHFVRYGADRKVESFESEQDRNDRAEKLAESSKENGMGSLDLDYGEYRRWLDFRKRCQAPLDELEAVWKKHEAARGITLKVAADRYMDLWKGTEPSFRHVRLHLKRLTDKYGLLPLADITHDVLRDFNAGLKDPKTGRPMSEVTKFDHRKNWNMFFQRCVLERWLQFNPCDLFTLTAPQEKERDILTAKQIFELLKANRDQPVMGKMAFELYGFLRSSSAARLTADHVKRDIKGLRLPGAAHKSTKTKFRQRHPDVLWAWFDHCKGTIWNVTTGIYDERKSDAFIRAHVENPGNVLRNSAITYMLAFTNNPPLVARLAQHTSLKMLEIYEGVATEQDAKLVMAMTPKEVELSWDDFVKKHHG